MGQVNMNGENMNRNEAIAYLTRCADDNGIHWYQGRKWDDVESCPLCHGTNHHDARVDNRYGTWTSQAASVACRHARIVAAQADWELDEQALNHSMSMVVNNHDDIQSDIREYAIGLSGANIGQIVRGYLTCQLWAQRDDGRMDTESGDGPDLDANYDVSDVAPEYVDKLTDEIEALVTEHPLAVRMYLTHRAWYHAGENGAIVRKRRTESEYDSDDFGHDYYLTREGHGAGFWDRGLGDLGDYLTDISKWAGSADDLWDNGDGVLR